MSDPQDSSANPYATTEPILANVARGVRARSDGGLALDYDIVVDDLIEFSVFHHLQSQTGRRQRGCVMAIALIATVLLIGLLGTAALRFLDAGESSRLFLLVALLVGVIAFPILFLRQKSNLRNTVARFYTEGSTESLTGWHEILLSPDGVQVRSARINTVLQWAAFQKIVRGPNLICFYFSAVNALIVPVRFFTNEEEIQTFLTTANRFLQQTMTQVPAS